MVQIAPSMLSADFLHLEHDVETVNSHADLFHLDIMDGVFVPNISFGFPVLEAMKGMCKKPMDVHLMIVEPQKFIKEVADCGAYMMNVHYEACMHLHRTVSAIKEAGMKAERIEIAKNLKALGLSSSIIQQSTGLSELEIQSL